MSKPNDKWGDFLLGISEGPDEEDDAPVSSFKIPPPAPKTSGSLSDGEMRRTVRGRSPLPRSQTQEPQSDHESPRSTPLESAERKPGETLAEKIARVMSSIPSKDKPPVPKMTPSARPARPSSNPTLSSTDAAPATTRVTSPSPSTAVESPRRDQEHAAGGALSPPRNPVAAAEVVFPPPAPTTASITAPVNEGAPAIMTKPIPEPADTTSSDISPPLPALTETSSPNIPTPQATSQDRPPSPLLDPERASMVNSNTSPTDPSPASTPTEPLGRTPSPQPQQSTAQDTTSRGNDAYVAMFQSSAPDTPPAKSSPAPEVKPRGRVTRPEPSRRANTPEELRAARTQARASQPQQRSRSTEKRKPVTPSLITPQQRRIPPVSSALSLLTPDYTTITRQPWSVTRRSQESLRSSSHETYNTNTVSVAVRVRPFTIGELQTSPRRVVSMNGDKLILVNPNAFEADPDTIAAAAAAVSLENMRCNDWAKVFRFDHCFWSYDPNDEEDTYADQACVYNSIGSNLVEHVTQGTSVACFTYGHTGTGKSYTMFGGTNRDNVIDDEGLCPRVFRDIISRILDDDEVCADTRITLTFVEIYQDKLTDCLNEGDAADLKVREHPSLGPYIENLTKIEISDMEEAMNAINRGFAERQRHSHSSRSHALVTLELAQIVPEVVSRSKFSTPSITKPEHVCLHMVDLASSDTEFNSKDEEEDRKVRRHSGNETSFRYDNNAEKLDLRMIRRSLSTLGYIIKELGHGSRMKGLPFRDSMLTWLLKDTFSNSCHTTMIANISPSHTCYDETLRTLKYVDRLSTSPHTQPNHVSLGDTIDPQLSYSLASEYARLKDELGGTRGTNASRALLKQMVADPQQRLARLDPQPSRALLEDAPRSRSSDNRPKTPASTSSSISASRQMVALDDSNAQNEIKEAYRQLHGKFVELQIELENARTDRDSLSLELQSSHELIEQLQQQRQVGSRAALSDLQAALKATEHEASELRGIAMRKEEVSEKLLNELAEERKIRVSVEKTARAQVTDLINRLEGLHKQNQSSIQETQKWQRECQALQQEKENVENDVKVLQIEIENMRQDSDKQIKSLEDELRLALDHVTTAVRERDRMNNEISVILREKADMAAREVDLVHKVRELQTELDKASNDNKLKSELEILKLQRDSLFEVIKQQEQALQIQQQQSEASLKMLHQRQAALDRFEQRHDGEYDDFSRLQETLQQLLAREGEFLSSELMDAKKLSGVIAHAREKVLEAATLHDELEKSKQENEDLRLEVEQLVHELKTKQETIASASDEIAQFKKYALDWEHRAHYWQQVAKKSATAHNTTIATLTSSTSSNHSTSVDKTEHKPTTVGDADDALIKLQTENTSLQGRLAATTEAMESERREYEASKEQMQKEFASLWLAVEQLNKLDASKDQSLSDLNQERDDLAAENRSLRKQLQQLQREFNTLQNEIQEIDLGLLDAADHEGIPVEEILRRSRDIVDRTYEELEVSPQRSHHQHRHERHTTPHSFTHHRPEPIVTQENRAPRNTSSRNTSPLSQRSHSSTQYKSALAERMRMESVGPVSEQSLEQQINELNMFLNQEGRSRPRSASRHPRSAVKSRR